MSYADWRGRFLEAVDESLYPAAWIDGRVADGTARFWENDGAAILADFCLAYGRRRYAVRYGFC